jgi:uncharacterized membrane protein YedE/YeeE
LNALLGGTLIGLAVMLLLLVNGRVAGVSGILGGLLSAPDRSWRLLFVAGLLGGGVIAEVVHPTALGPVAASLPILAVAGVLVGVGTRLAHGCTSGHGVCGVSRLSSRSLAATGIFMGIAMAVVALVRHGLG